MESRQLCTTFTISGTTSADTLTISAHTTGVGPTTQRFVDWTINGGAQQSANLLGVTNIVVDSIANTSGGGGDTVYIQKTPSLPVQVIGHSNSFLSTNDDAITIGDSNGLQDIVGTVSITRGSEGGLWEATLDDSGDTLAARAGTLSSGLSGVAPADITWPSNAIDGLTVNMGSFGGSSISAISPNVLGLTVTGYSQGADDSLVLGSNHSTDSVGQVAIAVAPGSPRGLWNVSVDDSAGAMPQSSLDFPMVSTGSLTGLTGTHGSIFGGSGFPNSLSWGPSSIRMMTIKPPPGDPVTISSLDVPMTVVSNNSTIAVGNSTNGLQSVTGALTIDGTAVVTLDDKNDVTSRTVLMSRVGTAVAIDGLAPATISYDLPGAISTGAPNVEMDLWNNFDGGVVTVLAAGQAGGLTKIVSNRPVAINVGNITTTPDIEGTLGVYCAASNLKNTLHVNDSVDVAARNLTVTATKDSAGAAMGVVRGLPGGGDVDYAATQTAGPVTIDGGTGGNTFLVNSTDATTGGSATGVPLILNLGSGNDTATVKTNAVTINGQGGNDSVTVDYSTVTLPNNGGTFSPGDVTFDGGANSDTLSIIGKLATQAFGVAATAITQGAQTTSFSNLESLALANGAFALVNDLGGLNLKVSGSGSTANFATTQHFAGLTIDTGASATVASSSSALGKTIFCTGISLTNGALNLTNNAIQLTYAVDPITTIRGYLKNGYNNGTWNGTPTVSTGAIASAAAASNTGTSIGFADSADAGNPAGLPINTIELRYTVLGDANLNGSVDISDYNAVVRNFGTGINWDQGDVTYETNVSINDYNAVVRNFGKAASSPAAMPTAQALTAESAQAGDTALGTADTSAHKKRSFSRKTVSSWKL